MGTSLLSYDQMEKICEIAEEAARKYITSRVPRRGILDLTITIDSQKTEELNVDIDVEVTLSPLLKNVNVEGLAHESVKAAFEAVEKYLKECGCR